MFKKRTKINRSAVRKRRSDDDDDDDDGATDAAGTPSEAERSETGRASTDESVLAAIQRTKKKQKLLASLPLASTTTEARVRGPGLGKSRNGDEDDDEDDNDRDRQRVGLATNNGPELSALGRKHQQAMQEYIEQQMRSANDSGKGSPQDGDDNDDHDHDSANPGANSIKDEESRLYQELADQVQKTTASVRGQTGSTLDPDQGSSSMMVGGNTGIAEVVLPPTGHRPTAGNRPLRRDAATEKPKESLLLRRHRFGKSEKSSSAIPSLTSDATRPLDMGAGLLLPTKFNATSSGVAQSRGMTTGSRSATVEMIERKERLIEEKKALEEAQKRKSVDEDRVGFQARKGNKPDDRGGPSSSAAAGGQDKPRHGHGGHRPGGYQRRSTRDDQAFRKFISRQFGR